jgi:hypothetical protein
MPTLSPCGSCGVIFAGVAAFDAHRLGSSWKPIYGVRGSKTRRRAASIFHCTSPLTHPGHVSAIAATRLDCYNQPASAGFGQGGSQGSGVGAQPAAVADLEEGQA